jgi:hypothetical protein
MLYKWLGVALGLFYPKWAYKLECKKCKMSFRSPKAHFEYVMDKIEREHSK